MKQLPEMCFFVLKLNWKQVLLSQQLNGIKVQLEQIIFSNKLVLIVELLYMGESIQEWTK